ncbi:hypothetical protein G647_08917 [Cladophialophora carrionii CBS 160.54]|uniref:Uncharacterized protein n=1 Tax=Cladophialophora carrionii CBS 160.54 TaxID=1279043 RepID=V9D1Q9_9EURO|nr:uncharacterized protein G647_08917 [Cladophialophora carrionii CBS 160.54]ETI19902.1 hypothetical protein G647_08917 [Cladophialophora carrionii CBS 160.54]
MAPFPSLTKEWHSEPYPSIDPTRPELSAKGKVIAITGGEGSIGIAVARAFARAGAERIAIVGRSVDRWSNAKREIECLGARVLAVRGDISDGPSIHSAFATIEREFGKVDVAVANAGYLPRFSSIPEADPDEWWKGFEVNTKGAFNTSRAFLAVAAPEAYLVDISSGIVHMPAKPGASSYISSKLAATKVYETVAAENESLHVVYIHPGVVRSELSRKAGMTAMDSADLAGQFVLWAVSPEAKFLRNKYLWANWDVDELKRRREELGQPHQLNIRMNGLPLC